MPNPSLHNLHHRAPRHPRPVLRHHHGADGFRDGVQHLHYLAVGVSFEDLWEGDWTEGEGAELVLDCCLFTHGGVGDGVGFLA